MSELLSRIGLSDEKFSTANYYFNAIGALGYYFVYGICRKTPSAEAPGELKFFDRAIVPVVKKIEGPWLPFGLSLITVISRTEEGAN